MYKVNASPIDQSAKRNLCERSLPPEVTWRGGEWLQSCLEELTWLKEAVFCEVILAQKMSDTSRIFGIRDTFSTRCLNIMNRQTGAQQTYPGTSSQGDRPTSTSTMAVQCQWAYQSTVPVAEWAV